LVVFKPEYLPRCGLLFISAVLVGMMLGSFSRVVGSVLSVPMCYVGMVAGLLVISTLVMLGSFTMVFRCVLVMFGRLFVVICAFVCHFGYLSMSGFAGRSISPFPARPSILPLGHVLPVMVAGRCRTMEVIRIKHLTQGWKSDLRACAARGQYPGPTP
jgi:hypothetical protein